jgi:heptosyltransferase-2
MERILVRLPNWLGDLLMARPMLHALRRAHPGARVVAVGLAAHLELLAHDGVIDDAHPWPGEGPGRAALAGALRARAADAALVLPPSFSSAWFAWRAGARQRIGYAHELREILLTHALPRPPRGELHLSREYLALAGALEGPSRMEPDAAARGARAAGAAPPPALPPLALPPGAEARAQATLARALAPEAAGRPIALLAPAARYGPAKRWAGSRFAAAGRALAARGFQVVVCGVASERSECEAVAAEAGRGAVSLAGATDLATQAALCARAAVALCNDSGLAHLAAAVGAPTVTIFGSTSSTWTAPLGPRVRVIQSAPVCAPCFQRTCRIGYRCLEAVGVERVARACLEVAA